MAKELKRLNGHSLVLASGKKVELQLVSGGKLTKEAIPHEELTRMLIEAVPEAARADIRVGRSPAPFSISAGGSNFRVEVDAFRESWSVYIRPDDGEDPNVIDFGSIAFTSAPARGADGAIVQQEGLAPSRAPEQSGGARPTLAGQGSLGSSSNEDPYGTPSSANRGPTLEALRPPARDAASVRSPELAPLARPRSSGAGAVEGVAPPPWVTGSEPETISDPGVRRVAPTVQRPVSAALEPPPWGQLPGGGAGAPPEVAQTPPTRAPIEPSTASGGEPEINGILRRLIQENGSDAHLTAGQVPRFRVSGNIQPMSGSDVISEAQLRRMLNEIMPPRVRKEFDETNDADFAHAIEGVSRFRVNAGMDRHGTFTVIRRIPFQILSPEQIGLPKKVLDLCWLTKGLVLVTGPTGSGKSTTLATLIDFINSNRQDHIITIEDPIEFVHPDNKRCLIRQREVGEHTGSFKRALRAALREDPDIVLVGELRDLETIAIAIETAETGHLVFGTVHTSTAPSTVDRVIDQFPAHQQDQIRVMLSESLKGVIAQTLCKRIAGGRVAAFEILLGNKAVSNLIREGKTFQIYSMMQTSKQAGMVTMNESLFQLLKNKVITPEEAFMRSMEKEEFRNMLDKAGIRVKLNTLIEDF